MKFKTSPCVKCNADVYPLYEDEIGDGAVFPTPCLCENCIEFAEVNEILDGPITEKVDLPF